MRSQLTLVCLLTLTVYAAAADRVPASGGDIEITPIVHASVQIEFGGKVIQVDPWSAGDLSKAKPADLILITDDPIHHLDPKAIEQLRKPGAPVVMPASGKAKVPDGIVLPNGEHTKAADIAIESIAAYDLKPGEPSHPKGDANGYLITLGGKRLLLAGVTECVPEIQALKNIDVAFMPMNIPPDRMAPQAAADCVKLLRPKIVYLYHYDQDYAARLTNPRSTPRGLASGMTVAQSVEAFRNALKNTGIEFRDAAWYPAR
jgi:L-ascorbate metabolism protein UlaG (beta-lactamase superfamily)